MWRALYRSAVVVTFLLLAVGSPPSTSGLAVGSLESEAAVLGHRGPPLHAPGGSSPRPEAFSVRPRTAEITIRYTGVPAEAQAAINAAAELWERQIVSPVETIADVVWIDLPEPGLGYVRSRGFTKDNGADSKLPVAGVVYPGALANAIRGSRVDSEPDMLVQFNADAPWYFGVDGDTPDGRYDLVTVAMHEFGQGLGLTSRFTVTGGVVSLAGLPSVYDTFMANSRGESFLSLLAQKPRALNAAVVQGDAYFSGAKARTATGRPPQLHAPAEWKAGTSLVHFNETEFGWPGANALFAPSLYEGVAIHDPGPVALAMLHDLGWEIAGIGSPARLGIAKLPAAVPGAGQTRLDIVVQVLDPVGALVATDNSTLVELTWFRSPSTTPGDCLGEASSAKTVVGGKATYKGCSVGGYGGVWYLARAEGLAPGISSVILFARSMIYGPVVARDP